jgi:hypothetical protein
LVDKKKPDRIKLQAVVSNLIAHAIEHVPIIDKEGHEIGTEKGDLTAIIHIFDRLEGKPTMKAEVKGEGHVVHEYRSIEDVRVFLLERGIDVMRVPAPYEIEDKSKR